MFWVRRFAADNINLPPSTSDASCRTLLLTGTCSFPYGRPLAAVSTAGALRALDTNALSSLMSMASMGTLRLRLEPGRWLHEPLHPCMSCHVLAERCIYPTGVLDVPDTLGARRARSSGPLRSRCTAVAAVQWQLQLREMRQHGSHTDFQEGMVALITTSRERASQVVCCRYKMWEGTVLHGLIVSFRIRLGALAILRKKLSISRAISRYEIKISVKIRLCDAVRV